MAVNYYGDEFNASFADAVCFDMDGVLADLYNQEGWEIALNSSDITPYKDALPLVDMQQLNDKITTLYEIYGVEPYVMSWGSGVTDLVYDKNIEAVKKRWLEKYLPAIPQENIFVTRYGVPKWELIPDHVQIPILFDDTATNCEDWPHRTAVFIKTPTAQEQIFSVLDEIIEGKKEAWGPKSVM